MHIGMIKCKYSISLKVLDREPIWHDTYFSFWTFVDINQESFIIYFIWVQVYWVCSSESGGLEEPSELVHTIYRHLTCEKYVDIWAYSILNQIFIYRQIPNISTDRRWVINTFIAYQGASYIRGLTVVFLWLCSMNMSYLTIFLRITPLAMKPSWKIRVTSASTILEQNIMVDAWEWASCHIRKIVGCACAGNAGNVFPATAG